MFFSIFNNNPYHSCDAPYETKMNFYPCGPNFFSIFNTKKFVKFPFITNNFFKPFLYNPTCNYSSQFNYNFEYPGLQLSYNNTNSPRENITTDNSNKDLQDVNQTLSEFQAKYSTPIPLPKVMIYSREKNGEINAKQPGGFYIPDLNILAVVSPKQSLEYNLGDLFKNDSEKSVASWYKKAQNGDFSQVDFIDPKFQKQVFSNIQLYLNNPNNFDEKAKTELGIEFEKLKATNFMLNHRPIEVIKDLYDKDENKEIIQKGKFKTLDEISKLPHSKQKEEFFNIINNLQRKKGNIYVDTEKIYEKQKQYIIAHELGHFLHHNTKLKNSFKTENLQFTEEEKQIAAKVSKYSITDPFEFVAEVYAGKMFNAEYSKDIMDLYYKFNGPTLP